MALDKRPLILGTCDHGVKSPGLRGTVRAVLDLGEVTKTCSACHRLMEGRWLEKPY